MKSLKELKSKSSINIVNDNEILLLNTTIIKSKSNWIQNFTVDIYIYTNRDLFDYLQAKSVFSFINMRKSLKQKIESIEKVHLKLHNVKVMEIFNVKYVPICKVNIISLGDFTS